MGKVSCMLLRRHLHLNDLAWACVEEDVAVTHGWLAGQPRVLDFVARLPPRLG